MTCTTVINQKGGVGKTTVSHALMSGLSKRGFRVLAVDLDPQENLSFTVRADTQEKNTGNITSFDIMTKRNSAENAVVHTDSGDIIPSSPLLSGADAFLTGTGREYILKENLQTISGDYDYIIIDTPPSLSVLTVNALTASDFALIPAQADVYSLQGISQLAETVELVRKYCNRSLKIAGILLTRHNSRTVLSRNISEMLGEQAENLGTRLFDTFIRESVTVKESQISQMSIFDYAPHSSVAGDFDKFIEEFLEVSK